jgi:pyridoxine/pyridoxamine 5'-phosphate oxidase
VSVASDDNGEIAPADEPIRHFKEWFAEASAHEPNDPDAMALATVVRAGLIIKASSSSEHAQRWSPLL